MLLYLSRLFLHQSLFSSTVAFASFAGLSVLQWNCRSLLRNQAALGNLLSDRTIHIAALCETHIDSRSILSFAQHEVISRDRSRLGGGVALLIHKLFTYQIVHLHELQDLCERNKVELIAAKIFISSQPEHTLTIFSLYSPPRTGHTTTEPDFWHCFLDICGRFDSALICGDFNRKHRLWSSQSFDSPNSEGARIAASLSLSSFVCLNTGDPTWTSADLSRTSVLDLTLASPALASRCAWSTLDTTYGSDHFPIIIDINYQVRTSIPCRPSISTKDICWDSFQNNCEAFCTSFQIAGRPIEESYNALLDNISTALTSAGAVIRNNRTPQRKPPKPWWDEECTSEIRKCNELFRDFKGHPCLANQNAYLAAKKEFSKFVKRKQRQAHRTFCESLHLHSTDRKSVV